MEPDLIKKVIHEAIDPDMEIYLEGADCNFSMVLVSESFEGKRSVSRQQTILGLFNEQLRSGELHALTIKAYTPTEWKQRQTPVQIQGL